MESESIAAAHERMAEQLQSDEHILGALPDAAAGVLLHWALARLDAVAAGAADPAALEVAFDQIRADARAVAEEAAAHDESAASLSARLGTSEVPAPSPENAAGAEYVEPPQVEQSSVEHGSGGFWRRLLSFFRGGGAQ